MAWATGLLLAAVLPQYLAGALVVEIRSDFAFTNTQLGAAVAASFAIQAVVSPTAGRVVEWIGVRRGVILSAMLVILAPLGTATVAASAAAIIALMAIGGLGGGIGSPSLSAFLASEVGVRRQGMAFGLFTASPQLAAFAAGLALPLLAVPLHWRVAYLVPSVIGIFCLIALVRHGMAPAPPRDTPERSPRPRPNRSVYAIAVSAALASAVVIGMRSFLIVFAVTVGFDEAAAGLLLAATGAVAIVSRVGFGVLGDRRPGRSLHRAAGLMGLGAVGFALMLAESNPLVVAGALLAGGVGFGWQAPLSLAVVSENRHAVAAAIGIQMSGFWAGGVVGPLLLGRFADHGSFADAWALCVGLSLAAAAILLLAPRLLPAGPIREA